ncbi:MAG: nucleotidyl transferase AbiEii/AbiGii toxin family protein [Bacteroidales bacterium]|nr:nucleotidyl transferase AbiEii/AbiGii toxin family protein [Bacteroidales bacterium]
MILQSEIFKIAEKEGVPPDTIDKNWVLGHFLAELFSADWASNSLIFKGGTCLKKCYFPDYRFSEDLDFTLVNPDIIITNKTIQTVCNNITDKIGIPFSNVQITPLLWNNKSVGYSSQIKYWGANHKKNQHVLPFNRWHTSIKIEIITYKKVANTPELRPLDSPFSDFSLFDHIKIPCYSISEIIAEKFRALLQRSYPAPRDYFDLWYLLKFEENINWNKIISTFIQKADFKHIKLKSYEDFFDQGQLKKVKQAWKNSLQNLLKENSLPEFDLVINELKDICQKNQWDEASSK